ncbi:hypothetical protein HDIA_1940 [Hartmannibacter diazotrophicus]|uniref:Uncharacterized protein n=1 Tax=Hartmannibacter diazotrophicus TaxID=1482074 RepID=A0A2C9D6V5_9HYPH|nr:hypothetical protein [Hartmannibacter diazotrophicus]SON55481.1 hypothetical protein HDIA_1940 [Hartmannibacter diazotrophicus]
MSATRPFAARIAAAAAVAAVVTAAGFAYAGARDTGAAGALYAAGAGFHQTIGTTHAIGTFTTAGNACAMTMVVGAADLEDALVQPARVAFSLPSGQQAAVETQDGSSLTFTCAKDAGSVRIAKVQPGAI